MVDNNLDTEKQSNAKLCIICMDEHNGILDQHPCSVCSKDSWFCCQNCIFKLEKCPICRTEINNDIDPYINSKSWYNKIREKWNQYLDSHIYINYLILILECIAATAIVLLYLLYLGKVIVYIYCTVSCDSDNLNTKGCVCYVITEKNNYWTNIIHNFGGSIVAGLIGHWVIMFLYKFKYYCNTRNN